MKHGMIKEGADQKFLDENMPVVLQQMQMQGYLQFLPGGRVMPSGGAAGGLRLQRLPADLQALKGRLDGPLIRLIMASDPMNGSDLCFATLQDYDGAREYKKAIELGLLDSSDRPSSKNCAKMIHIIPTEKMGKAQGFLYSSALAVLGN
jgi:hypothetical protein